MGLAVLTLHHCNTRRERLPLVISSINRLKLFYEIVFQFVLLFLVVLIFPGLAVVSFTPRAYLTEPVTYPSSSRSNSNGCRQHCCKVN